MSHGTLPLDEAALCSFVVRALAQGTSADKLEIAGVRTGMTEAEATAAPKAFDATLTIAPVMGVFNYSDGVNPSLKSPEFLDRPAGSLGNQAELLDLGALVATERSRTAWIEQLQTEAVRKREGQGQTPKL